ncbi:hypothetical protein GCM10027040_05080 [Halomonas shantousis]
MKGKQSVYYRTCTDEFLIKLSELPKSVGEVICELLNHIDIHDNCVQKSFPEIVKEKAWDRANKHKALCRLRDEGVIKEVVDAHGDCRWMVDPRLVWSTKRDELKFSIVMFLLGSHEEASKHREAEKSVGGEIDPLTGQMVGEFQDRVEFLDWLYE